jgi:hypothetical protein
MGHEIPREIGQNAHIPEIFGITKPKTAISLDQTHTDSGNVMGSIWNARAKVVILLYLIRDLGPILA